MPTSAWANAKLWDREYAQIRAIPSSHRLTPSHSLQALESELKPAPGVRVLDAGCGTGRHALHFARQGCTVDAVDISEAACSVLEERVTASGLAVFVINEKLDAARLPDARYHIILDSYVSCHILNDDERTEYLDGLRRLLLPDGRLYTACLGSNDEYYSDLESDSYATDPLNGITKLLQQRSEFRENLALIGRVDSTIVERFDDRVSDRMYSREVLAAVVTS